MAKLNYIIDSQAYEKIRDRIGEILADEISNQATLDTVAGADINAKVWAERTQAFSHTETPAVNILLARGDYSNSDATMDDGTYLFQIDAYTSSKADTVKGKNGDLIAAQKLQRLMGIIRTILTDSAYRTLGFSAPFIEGCGITGISFLDPQIVTDTISVHTGRIIFSVRVPELGLGKEPTIIDSYKTSIKLSTTDEGYLFIGETYS